MKSPIRLLALMLTLAAASAAFADNWPHVHTGGFDYDESDVRNNPTEAQWLATHHDMIVGLQTHGTSTTFDKMHEDTYDLLKSYNSQVKLVGYVPFQTIMQYMSTWMESYASSHGMNPEDLYCHYDVDTPVLDRDGTTRTFKGYPHGTATSRAASRVMSSWWHGSLPNVCPVSQTFRTVYVELLKEAVSINASKGKYLDGVFLDTFEGSVDTYYKLKLENTVEMKNLGKTTYDTARSQMINDMVNTRNQAEQALTTLIGRTSYLLGNGADADNFYNWYTDVYSSRYSTSYDQFGIEYMLTSSEDSVSRITRLKQVYDDFTNSSRPIFYFVNSQTNYDTGVPLAFTQFILSAHYLINHPNGYFSYHVGSAGNYGPTGGSFRNSHWHKNLEYNIGTPKTHTGTDYWGSSNTDRFYVFADGGSTYKVLAREYTNALVLAKFGPGGWSTNGTNKATYQLPGTFHQLNADNTLGPAITSISLGYQDGAILIRDGSSGGSGGSGGSNTPPGNVTGNKRGSDAK